MPKLGNALDFSQFEGKQFRAHQLGGDPSSPVTGQLYFNNVNNTLWWWDGSAWVSARGGASATPPATTGALGTIQLAGDLTGTATSPQIATGVITDVEVATGNKDGVAGTASMRTLGSGAQQAAPGNDARFTDARAPTAHHLTHEPGGSDAMAVNAAAATGSLRTLALTATAAMPGNTALDAITVAANDVNLNGKKITSLSAPTAAGDAANKAYVDAAAQGLDAKASAKAASTANLALTGAQTVDGIALVTGDRILVKDQSAPAQNGIYVVAVGAWTRASDTDTWAEVPSAYVWVEQGTQNADTGWLSTADQGGTLDTTAIPWVQFSGAGSIVAGAGLTKTGNTLDVVGTANRILVNPDSVDIASTYTGQASITTVGTIATGTWNGTTIAVANGGTGQATPKAARETGLVAAGYYSSATHGAGATITITAATHGLRASRGLIVQTQVESDGSQILADFTVAANGDVVVTFGASQSANSIRVTIIG